jgi:hypothetical protein
MLLEQLKGWKELGTLNKDAPGGQWEAFSTKGFYDWLTKWIAVDDQVHGIIFISFFQ